MAHEHDPDTRSPRRLDDRGDATRERISILDMPHDADLHVVDEKREALRTADLLERLRDVESERVLHLSPSLVGVSRGACQAAEAPGPAQTVRGAVGAA